jgi:hypothetical protein
LNEEVIRNGNRLIINQKWFERTGKTTVLISIAIYFLINGKNEIILFTQMNQRSKRETIKLLMSMLPESCNQPDRTSGFFKNDGNILIVTQDKNTVRGMSPSIVLCDDIIYDEYNIFCNEHVKFVKLFIFLSRPQMNLTEQFEHMEGNKTILFEYDKLQPYSSQIKLYKRDK